MSGGPVAAWRQIPGTGQQISFTASSVAASNVVGAQTYAIQVNAITNNCIVSVDRTGTASVTNGQLVKSTDFGTIIACTPGDKVAAIGVGGSGTLYLTELTH